MPFHEFLSYVRVNIGNHASDAWWRWQYLHLADTSRQFILEEMPFLAIRAYGHDIRAIQNVKEFGLWKKPCKKL